jgi:hypothetical protein
MKQIVFLAFLLFISCGQNNKKSEASVNSASTQDINNEDEARISSALKFINTYVTSSADRDEWVKSSDMVTESFKVEYQRIIDEAKAKDPELGLGFDPILNAQDYPDQGFELESLGDEDNYIFLKGKDVEQFKVIVKVVKKDDKWLVDGSGIINIPESLTKK